MASQQIQQPYRCTIDTEKKAYYPGDIIRSNIALEFDRKFNCDEIVALFTGEARVYWIEKQVAEKGCRHLTYYQKRSLFEMRKPIWTAELVDVGKKKETTLTDLVRFASPNAIKSRNLQSREKKLEFRGFDAGKHELPVEFGIPNEGIYSSLEVHEELVSIRYQIEIHCLVDGRITKKFHQILHVFAPRDLSEEMDKVATPVHVEKIYKAKIGNLKASLTLPKTGYTPGEPLCAQIAVHNMTSSSVKFASVCIVKKVTAIADKPIYEFRERNEETAGSILPFPKIQKGERKEWMAQFHVPALTPNLCIDDFIHVNYEACLAIGFDRGKRKNAVLHLMIPLTIGTVAIESYQPEALPSKVSPEKESHDSLLFNDPDKQLRHRMTALNLSHGLPSAPPMYEEVVGQMSAYSQVDDQPPPFRT